MYCNNFLLVVTSYLMDKEDSICFACITYFPTSQYDMHA